jgi:hypothetical protein
MAWCHFALFWLFGHVYFQHIMFTALTYEMLNNQPPPKPKSSSFRRLFFLFCTCFWPLHGSTCSFGSAKELSNDLLYLNNFHSQKVIRCSGPHRSPQGCTVRPRKGGNSEPAPTSATIKDGWYVIRKQFSVGFQFPG